MWRYAREIQLVQILLDYDTYGMVSSNLEQSRALFVVVCPSHPKKNLAQHPNHHSPAHVNIPKITSSIICLLSNTSSIHISKNIIY